MLIIITQIIMNHQNIKSSLYNNVEENDGDTDYVTCPLLQLKYSRPRRTITR